MKNIIFIAPPAAGKGTQSALINEKYGIPNISMGALLREYALKDPMVKEKLSQGKIIDEHITLGILDKRLQENDCNNGYILDGFPRTLYQTKAYEDMLKAQGKEIGTIIVLDLDKEEAKNRIVGRLSCTKCGTVYNTMFEEMKPKVENVCDKCGTTLSKRSDDNAEVFEERFQTYLKETAPVIDYLESKYLVHHVNSGINREYTFEQIENIIQKENTISKQIKTY